MTFEDHFNIYWRLAENTFDTKAHESSKGLIKESKELDEALNDEIHIDEHILEEIADVQMYLIYILRKKGYSYTDLKIAITKKMQINRLRKWDKNEDGTFSHIK